MDARIKRFRQEASQQGAGAVGKRYSAQLRRLAVAVVEEHRDEPLSRIARALGVSDVSLQRWVEQAQPARFRPVQVSLESEPEAPVAGGLVLITPRGYRVEGLDAASLISLLGRLG
jgi:transposase-like protein